MAPFQVRVRAIAENGRPPGPWHTLARFETYAEADHFLGDNEPPFHDVEIYCDARDVADALRQADEFVCLNTGDPCECRQRCDFRQVSKCHDKRVKELVNQASLVRREAAADREALRALSAMRRGRD